SLIGGTLSLIVLVGFAPLLASIGGRFGSPEFFSLILFALVMSAVVSGADFKRSFSMILVGMLIGLVGMDVNSGIQRFTLNTLQLADGVNLVIIVMGIFGIAEVCRRIDDRLTGVEQGDLIWTVTLRSLMPSREDVMRSRWPI